MSIREAGEKSAMAKSESAAQKDAPEVNKRGRPKKEGSAKKEAAKSGNRSAAVVVVTTRTPPNGSSMPPCPSVRAGGSPP